MSIDAHNGPTREAAWSNFESLAGRRMDVDRQFKRWDQPCVDAGDRVSVSVGRTLLISWDAIRLDGTHEKWARIASGAVNRRIDACAAALKSLGATVEFSFQHEPETRTGPGEAGTAAEYIAAYRHVVRRMRAAAVPARYVPIFMAITARQGLMTTWYPGNAWTDAVGFDGYNWYGCVNPNGPWVRPAYVFGAAYTFTTSVGKPMVIAEWGTGEDPAVPGRKAQWIDDLAATIKGWPNVVEVNIFNSGRNKNCPRYADTSASSLAAFVAMGADGYYNTAG